MSNILSPNLEKYGRHGIRRKNGVIHTIVHKIQGGVTMILSEKERTTIEDLQTQEKVVLRNTECTPGRQRILS